MWVCVQLAPDVLPADHRGALSRILYRHSPSDVVVAFRRCGPSRIMCKSEFICSYAPHNDVSVNDGPRIRQWSHKIIILKYSIIIPLSIECIYVYGPGVA